MRSTAPHCTVPSALPLSKTIAQPVTEFPLSIDLAHSWHVFVHSKASEREVHKNRCDWPHFYVLSDPDTLAPLQYQLLEYIKWLYNSKSRPHRNSAHTGRRSDHIRYNFRRKQSEIADIPSILIPPILLLSPSKKFSIGRLEDLDIMDPRS